ncbi:MAG: response regulator [Spirochaetales bacterium]|nr:MAG: response regulator [Spirochaetales bacterium]
MLKLLVMGAEDFSRNTLAAFLDLQEGLSVIGRAENESGAVSLSREKHPDIVIADISIHKYGGLALTEQILTQPMPPAVILLMVTRDNDFRQAALKAGAFDCLEKSSGIDRLLEAIRAAGSFQVI